MLRVLLTLAVFLAACSPSTFVPPTAIRAPTDTDTPIPTNTATATRTPLPTNTPRPTNTRTRVPTATPTTAPLILSGTGDGFVDVNYKDAVGIILAVHTGRRNFVVYTVDANNNEDDLLVNTIGKYTGTVLFFSEGVRRLSVQADGEWVLSVLPLSWAERVSVPSTFTGENDDVVILTGEPDTLTVTTTERDNVIVYGYGGGDVDLLVNEIGPYVGTVLVPRAVQLLEIKIDGAWTMEIK